MINIYFFYTGKRIYGFKIDGHSNFFKRLGFRIKKSLFKKEILHQKDYICSAVASAAYMAVIGLVEVKNKKIVYKQNDTGFLECRLKEKPDNISDILFESLLRILEKIKDKYPGHLTIKMEA